MIKIHVDRDKSLTLTSGGDPDVRRWLDEITSDPFFVGRATEEAILSPVSDSEEFNEDWEDYAAGEVVDLATSWQKKFRSADGGLRFTAETVDELVAFINRARLKIAMDGTGDVLPPSAQHGRAGQFQFLTGLLSFLLEATPDIKREFA